AQDELEDWGAYAVPHLIAVMNQAHAAGASRVQDVAIGMLRLAARRPLLDPFNPNPSEELKALNREIDLDNARIRDFTYTANASEQELQLVVRDWNDWYEARHSRFKLSATQKSKAFLFETRFAKYWENLLSLAFGVSLVSREPVLETLISKLKYSLSLSLGSLLLAYLISIPIGIFSAVKKDSPADRAVTVGLFMLYSLPSFFVATLVLFF